MRPFLTTLTILLLFAATALAPSIITDFTAENGEDYVLLTWNSGTESGLSFYQIERSLDGIEFQAIGTMTPQGSNSSYEYEDHDLYKMTSRTYFYRINATMTNGSSNYSSVAQVTLSFSGIQQTWGSIKSLFR